MYQSTKSGGEFNNGSIDIEACIGYLKGNCINAILIVTPMNCEFLDLCSLVCVYTSDGVNIFTRIVTGD